jgi:hypothetical protein
VLSAVALTAKPLDLKRLAVVVVVAVEVGLLELLTAGFAVGGLEDGAPMHREIENPSRSRFFRMTLPVSLAPFLPSLWVGEAPASIGR